MNPKIYLPGSKVVFSRKVVGLYLKLERRERQDRFGMTLP